MKHENTNIPKKIISLIVFIIICEAVGIIGGLATYSSLGSWYADLQKPSLTPPNWIFGPVWTSLYALMGISAWLIYHSKSEQKQRALTIFFTQLFINFIWSFLFFGLKSTLWGFVGIIALLLSIILTMIKFHKISKWAFGLLVPYLLWVSFATYISGELWYLNR
ncbi:MAG: TspO/MBR family protein [Candidatus Caenarcaniphilales bacterium]|nr:TspO/MBR family protein [Candidatus Caenarcaniphilales bacterium]